LLLFAPIEVLIIQAAFSNQYHLTDTDSGQQWASFVDVDEEKLQAQAYASMPASYIANYIYCTNTNF